MAFTSIFHEEVIQENEKESLKNKTGDIVDRDRKTTSRTSDDKEYFSKLYGNNRSETSDRKIGKYKDYTEKEKQESIKTRAITTKRNIKANHESTLLNFDVL